MLHCCLHESVQIFAIVSIGMAFLLIGSRRLPRKLCTVQVFTRVRVEVEPYRSKIFTFF